MVILSYTLLSGQSPLPIYVTCGLLLILSALLIYMCTVLSKFRRRVIRYEKEIYTLRKELKNERRERELLSLVDTSNLSDNNQSSLIDEPVIYNQPTLEHTYENYINGTITHNDRVFMQRLTSYIEQHIDSSDLVVNKLCDFMGVTPLVLNKKLKTLVDMTANVYIRAIRLHRAAQLLRTARYTVADVTYDVGFSDLRYFRECFKKEFGMLPQEYKDQNANTEDTRKIKEEKGVE